MGEEEEEAGVENLKAEEAAVEVVEKATNNEANKIEMKVKMVLT